MPTAESARARPAKRPRSIRLERRRVRESATTCSMVRTLVMGWPGSTSRTAARTAAVIAAGSLRVRTT